MQWASRCSKDQETFGRLEVPSVHPPAVSPPRPNLLPQQNLGQFSSAPSMFAAPMGLEYAPVMDAAITGYLGYGSTPK